MSGTAVIDIRPASVRVTTGRTVEDTLETYDTDAKYNYAIKALAWMRGDSIPFLLTPTDHVYYLDPVLLGVDTTEVVGE